LSKLSFNKFINSILCFSVGSSEPFFPKNTVPFAPLLQQLFDREGPGAAVLALRLGQVAGHIHIGGSGKTDAFAMIKNGQE
jgi:hypothetical protein